MLSYDFGHGLMTMARNIVSHLLEHDTDGGKLSQLGLYVVIHACLSPVTASQCSSIIRSQDTA